MNKFFHNVSPVFFSYRVRKPFPNNQSRKLSSYLSLPFPTRSCKLKVRSSRIYLLSCIFFCSLKKRIHNSEVNYLFYLIYFHKKRNFELSRIRLFYKSQLAVPEPFWSTLEALHYPSYATSIDAPHISSLLTKTREKRLSLPINCLEKYRNQTLIKTIHTQNVNLTRSVRIFVLPKFPAFFHLLKLVSCSRLSFRFSFIIFLSFSPDRRKHLPTIFRLDFPH